MRENLSVRKFPRIRVVIVEAMLRYRHESSSEFTLPVKSQP